MSRQRAQFILDRDRRAEQEAFLRERAEDIQEFGDQLWGLITEEQAPRLAEQGIVVQFHPGSDVVLLPSVMFRPPAEIPEPPADLTASEPQGDERAAFIAQFVARPDASWIDALSELGAELIEDLPPQAALLRLTAAQAAAARELPFVAWVGLYHPAYALHYPLAGRTEPFDGATLRDLQVDAALPTSDAGNLQVLPFADVSVQSVRSAVEGAGAIIRDTSGSALIVSIAASRVRELLRVPGIKAVEIYDPGEAANQRAGIILGANQIRFRNVDFLTNLDGTGEIVHVHDSGLDNGAAIAIHPDLAGRIANLINANDLPAVPTAPVPPAVPVRPTADFAPHGTHVAGSITGNGTQALGTAPLPATIPRGMAPNAQIFFSSVTTAAPPAPTVANPTPPAPSNFRARFLEAMQAASNAGARVHNHSWGNSFPFNNQSNYTNANSGATDRFAYLNPENVVLFAAGNFEGDYDTNGALDMNRLSPEACGKNVLTVGACENDTTVDGFNGTYLAFPPVNRFVHANFAALAPPAAPPPAFTISDNPNHLALFSQRGRVQNPAAPTRRRVKPDLVAPGTNIVSLNRIAGVAGAPQMGPAMTAPATTPAAFYGVLSGTSMATPMVSGACVLVRQFYRARFGQLRRPQLLEVLTAFVDNPAIASHRDGLVVAWVRRDGAGNSNIVGARFSRQIVRVGNIVPLKANVGPQPALALARSGDNTLLLYRGADNKLRLSLFDRQLAPVNAFGTAGVVTLAPDSRAEDDRRAALCVHDNDVAVTWHQTGTDNLVFQRFRADTGAALDANPQTLGVAGTTSPHPYLLHNGAHYAAVWARVNGVQHEVVLRFIANDSTPEGANPIVLVAQQRRLLQPQLAWNPRRSRFRVAWVSEDVHAGGDIISQGFNADGSPDPAQTATRVVTVPAANETRRPFLALHPVTGYALLWEDNIVNNRFDVCLALLSEDGVPDTRVPANRLPISDTPDNTQGFAALMDADGVAPLWFSSDEVNSDVLAAFLLNVTPQGAFQAQSDPNTPLLNSGRYVPNRLREHDAQDQTGVALAWAGGPLFHLRSEIDGLSADLHLVRTNADGLPDAAFGPGGARRIDRAVGQDGFSVAWAGTRLMVVTTFDFDAKAFLFDADGNPETTFGTNGVALINERTSTRIFPQLGFSGSGNSFRMVVAYGRHDAPTPFLRCVVFDRRGNTVVAARDLHDAEGTARHGWFHFVTSDTPARAIAAWHERTGAGQAVIRLNRFNLSVSVAGMPEHAGPVVLTGLLGDSQNAVLAPRPALFDPPFPATGASLQNTLRREYGMAWQNLLAPGGRWQILFSHLNRDGTVSGVRDVPVVSHATDHATDPQLVWHTNGYGLAWRQQPAAGGPHRLMFTLVSPGGAVTAPAPHQVSLPTADVQAFQLVWNGRTFRIGWTETEGTVLRHQQAGIAVPRVNPAAGFDQPYQHPTSSLVRATLINGATNINQTALPNIASNTLATHNPNDGYGWGRVNLRQSLAPAPPVTFHVRDDSAVATGRIARYEFTLPPDTRLLRVTLVWTDPPGNGIVKNLNLRLTTPPFPPGPARTYVGNRWQAAPNAQFSDPLPTPAPTSPFESIHTVEQIVIPGAPTLPAGVYVVEVIGGPFGPSVFQQFPGQHFSLVFTGSGLEWPLVRPAALPAPLPFF